MRGRRWMIVGAVVGVGIAVGHVPFLAGAARSLADTAQHVVGDGGHHLIRAVATSGAPQRVVLGFTAVIAVLLPGVTSLLLIVAARGTLRLRAIVGLAVVALGGAAYVYQPRGVATGEIALALAVAGLAVALTGPFVPAPLAGLAALIGATFLPQLVSGHSRVTDRSINALHLALTNSPGTPTVLQVLLLLVAAVPFAIAARLLVRS